MNKGLLGFARRERPNGLYYLGSRQCAGTSFVDFRSVLTEEFDDYKLVLSGVRLTGAAGIGFYYSPDNGASWNTGNVFYYVMFIFSSAATGNFGGTPGTSFLTGQGNDAGWTMNGEHLLCLNSYQRNTTSLGRASGRDTFANSNAAEMYTGGHSYASTRRPNAIRVFYNLPAVAGSVRLYGYHKGRGGADS